MSITHGDDAEFRHRSDGLDRLDEAACWAFMARHKIGRVALIQHQRPMVFPVNFALDGQRVVFRTARGTTLSAAAREAMVAFEVDEVDELFERGTSVIVHGVASEVTDQRERQRLAGLPIRPWASGDRDHFVRIEPRWISGRSIPRSWDFDGLAADGG